MDETKKLGTEPILKLIAKFSIPSVIAMFVNAIYNIVDRIYIGKFVGENALGGLTIAFPFMMITFAFGALFAIGGSSLIAIKFGEQNNEEAQSIFGNMVTLVAGGALLMSILGTLLLDPILMLCGATDNILPFAHDYMRIILLGLPFQMSSFAMAALVRVQGKPRLSMMSQLTSALTNIVLDYIFIVPMGTGVFGAALATIIGQAVGFCILSYYFFISGRSILKFNVTNLKLKLQNVKQMANIGLSSFVMNIGNSLSASFVNLALATHGGDAAITSMGAINSLFTLVLMPVFGLQQGLGPIIGYNHGMGDKKRVAQTLWTGMGIAVAFAGTVFLALELFPTRFASLFLDPSSDTMKMCANGLRIYIAMLPLLPVNVIGTAFFQSTAQGTKAFMLSISRQALFLIPAVLLLPSIWGLTGVWVATPVADFLSISLTLFFLYRNHKRQ